MAGFFPAGLVANFWQVSQCFEQVRQYSAMKVNEMLMGNY